MGLAAQTLPTNTPGLLYAVAYVLSAIVTASLVGARPEFTWRRALGNLAGAAFITLVMWLTGGVQGFAFAAVMGCVAIVVVLLLALNLADATLRRALYYFPLAFLLGEVAASLTWQLYYFAVDVGLVAATTLMLVVFCAVTFAAVFGAAWLVGKRVMGRPANMHIHKADVAHMLAILAGTYLLANASYLLRSTPFSSTHTMETYIVRTVTEFGGIAVLLAVHLAKKSVAETFENQMLRQAMEQQYANYQVSEESVALVNQKYHDLKHQIAILKAGGAGSSEMLAGLDQIERSVKQYEAENKTGNHVLDTILTAKSLTCQGRGIEFKAVADGEAIGFMDDADVAALFGNIIDNAIEAVEKVGEGERLITLSVSRQKGFLRIREENRCVGTPTIRDGVPVTTKRDRRYHGFGTKSIRQTAEKYQGDAHFTAEDGWFRVSILIPVPAA